MARNLLIASQMRQISSKALGRETFTNAQSLTLVLLFALAALGCSKAKDAPGPENTSPKIVTPERQKPVQTSDSLKPPTDGRSAKKFGEVNIGNLVRHSQIVQSVEMTPHEVASNSPVLPTPDELPIEWFASANSLGGYEGTIHPSVPPKCQGRAKKEFKDGEVIVLEEPTEEGGAESAPTSDASPDAESGNDTGTDADAEPTEPDTPAEPPIVIPGDYNVSEHCSQNATQIWKAFNNPQKSEAVQPHSLASGIYLGQCIDLEKQFSLPVTVPYFIGYKDGKFYINTSLENAAANKYGPSVVESRNRKSEGFDFSEWQGKGAYQKACYPAHRMRFYQHYSASSLTHAQTGTGQDSFTFHIVRKTKDTSQPDGLLIYTASTVWGQFLCRVHLKFGHSICPDRDPVDDFIDKRKEEYLQSLKDDSFRNWRQHSEFVWQNIKSLEIDAKTREGDKYDISVRLSYNAHHLDNQSGEIKETLWEATYNTDQKHPLEAGTHGWNGLVPTQRDRKRDLVISPSIGCLTKDCSRIALKISNAGIFEKPTAPTAGPGASGPQGAKPPSISHRFGFVVGILKTDENGGHYYEIQEPEPIPDENIE